MYRRKLNESMGTNGLRLKCYQMKHDRNTEWYYRTVQGKLIGVWRILGKM